MTVIIGLRLDNRLETALELQKVLTNFGCIIKTRLGIHEATEDKCAHNGIIILEVIDDEQSKLLEEEASKISGLEIQRMHFS